VEVIEPYHGAVFDPATGSGGMFVQSARFVSEHKKEPSRELSIHGHEKVGMNVALARMNLAMHGLEGDVREANSYYEDPFESTNRFDFVLANPPFNNAWLGRSGAHLQASRHMSGYQRPSSISMRSK
jgi:type I restriction enzyme M protein